MDCKKKKTNNQKIELHYSTKKTVGLLLSSVKDLMMFKLFRCPSAASTAGKSVSLVKQSNTC